MNPIPVTDFKEVLEFANGKDVVAHLIPEYLGFDKTMEIVERIDENHK